MLKEYAIFFSIKKNTTIQNSRPSSALHSYRQRKNDHAFRKEGGEEMALRYLNDVGEKFVWTDIIGRRVVMTMVRIEFPKEREKRKGIPSGAKHT